MKTMNNRVHPLSDGTHMRPQLFTAYPTDECAMCFEEDGALVPAPCCGKGTTTTTFCRPCMQTLQQTKGMCPICAKRIDTRQGKRQWAANSRPQMQRYEPAPLPPRRPATRKERNNVKRSGRSAAQAQRKQTEQRPTQADGEQLHISRRNATGYVGVWKDKGKTRYRAEFRNHTLGSFPTALAAAIAYARVARRES